MLLVLLMVLGGVVAGLLWGPWVALAVVVGLPLLLAFHIVWRDHAYRIRARIRQVALLSGTQLRNDLQELRGAVYQQLLTVESHLANDAAPAEEA